MTEAKNIEEEMKRYIECMKQILHRMGVIIEIIDNGKTLGNDFFDFEVTALHFRKILELIAFSTLTANRDLYESEIKEARNAGYHADNILKAIERVNPGFYPEPQTHPKKIGDGKFSFESITNGFLTREEFKKLYGLCGNALHVKNIFKDNQEIDFKNTQQEWLKKIGTLLDCHTVKFPNEDRWLVIMKENGEPRIYYLGKVSF